MEEEINKVYVEDKPHSLVVNIDYMMCMKRKMCIKPYTKVIFIQVLNNIDVRKHSPQSMSIEKENCFNLMLYFLQDKNWWKQTMGTNIYLQPLMFSQKWLGSIL